jgi:hypothetical protein
MSGNVAEWEDSCENQTGPRDACHVRGGAFNGVGQDVGCRSAAGLSRRSSAAHVGFRCCGGDAHDAGATVDASGAGGAGGAGGMGGAGGTAGSDAGGAPADSGDASSDASDAASDVAADVGPD